MGRIIAIKQNRSQFVVVNDDSHFQIRKKAASKIASLALNHLRYQNTSVSLIFTSDSKIRRINRRFLNHDRPTDVLAFPFMNSRPAQKMKLLGEIIISPKRAFVQASFYRTPVREELARYICHGILHLAGFSDKTKKGRDKMQKQEDKILTRARQYVNRII